MSRVISTGRSVWWSISHFGRAKMLRQHSFRTHPEAHFAFNDSTRSASAKQNPRQNHLLAALPLKDYERLLPMLEPVPLPVGWTIHGANAREKHLYFVTAGLVSRYYDCLLYTSPSPRDGLLS